MGQALKGPDRSPKEPIPEAREGLLLQSYAPSMQRLLASARRAAGSDATILLSGESGVGKSFLARQIHLWSPRREKPFLMIDCASLLQRSQEWSFGPRTSQRRGVQRKLGRLAATEGGTLFLANIHDLPLFLQSEFARFLEKRSITTTVGENPIDVRLIAASSRDLAAAVQAHQFLADLYYSLNIVSLCVPPLRERPADILPLAEFMLAAAACRNHRGSLRLSENATAAMLRYPWPGNIRELRNAMEAAAILCRGDVIALENLPQALSRHAARVGTLLASKVSLDETERQYILRVLSESQTLQKAAAVLGINVTTLWRKRKRYKLDDGY